MVLADVLPGGPADRAGLKIGDVVLSLNDKSMENARQLHVNLYRHGVGSIVTLHILRGAEAFEKQVVVLARSNGHERFAAQVNDRQHLVPRLSILALNIDASIAALLPGSPRRSHGILVARLAVTTTGPRATCFLATSSMRSIARWYPRCRNFVRSWKCKSRVSQLCSR